MSDTRTTSERAAVVPPPAGDAHAEAQAAFFAGQDVQSRDRVAFYDPFAEEPPVVVFPGVNHNEIMNVPDNIRSDIDLNAWYEGRFRVRGLVNHADDGGYSVLQVQYEPNGHIPAHYHDVDQVVVVVKGTLFQGKRRFDVGAGYYTPAYTRYSVTAGPEGVTVLEYRNCRLSDFDTVYVEKNPERWR